MVAGAVVYEGGRFTRVDRGAALHEVHESLQRSLGDDEIERRNPWADLWVDEETGIERERCPFVRKVRGQQRYLCTIYETRPQTCRDGDDP
jgi:Fe-S-cluster containining protein